MSLQVEFVIEQISVVYGHIQQLTLHNSWVHTFLSYLLGERNPFCLLTGFCDCLLLTIK